MLKNNPASIPLFIVNEYAPSSVQSGSPFCRQ